MIQPAPRYRMKDIALIRERSRSIPGDYRLAPESFLPLSEPAYQILLALAGPPLSDQALAQIVEANSYPGMLMPGTLRTTLARLAAQGLAQEHAADSTDPSAEPPYRVTELGYAVLLAESGRRRRGRGAA
jgi:hypothetical protein